MKLKRIEIAKLFVLPANMRAEGKPDLSQILPSIRARGELVPLIVRLAQDAERFEIVAGKQRYRAALALALESGEVDAATVPHPTLASKGRQRESLALLDDREAYCPTGYSLKAWLFGGTSIPVTAALFDVGDYQGETVSDLFGKERYFADGATFWTAQTAAAEAKAEGYRAVGCVR